MALQKVDAVIAGVGAVALLATVLGVVFYEDLAGEQIVGFPTADQELAAQTGASGTPLNFGLPDNSTRGTLSVQVDLASGSQAGQGGTAGITIDITGPNGLVGQATGSMTFAPGATTGSVTIDVPEFTWAEIPAAVTADPASVDETQGWDEDLVVTVTVDAPDDNLGAIPGGPVSYAFEVTVTPTVTVYAAVTETPDVETV